MQTPAQNSTVLMSPIGIFTTDVNLHVTSWNDWLANTTGLSEEFVIGKPIIRVIPDLEKRGLYERFLHVITEGIVELLSSTFHHYLIKIPLLPPAGEFSEMQQRVTIAPLAQEEEILGTLVTIEDVTKEMILRIGKAASSGGIQSLSSQDWAVRREAAESLSSAGKTIISEVLRRIRLEHKNLSILSSAMKVISMSEADVSDFLIEFLSDKDTELRIYAAQMLGEKNSPVVVEALINALDDPDTNVRYHAIESLGKLRAFQAVEKLAEIAMARDFFTSFPAIDALKAIGDQRASRLIYPLIDDEVLGQPVLEALGELGEAESVPALADMINRNSPDMDSIVKTLARIADRYAEMLHEGEYIGDIVARHVSHEGIKNLLAFIDSDKGKKDPGSIVKILGWIDNEAICKALTRYLGNPETRRQAIDSFVSWGQKVVDLLISQLQGEPEIRQSAITALGRIGGEKAAKALIPLLKDDDVAVITCGALSKIGYTGAYDYVIVLLGHENVSIRRAAIAALNSLGHPDMARQISVLLSDKNPHVRESSLRIAGYFGFPGCESSVHRLCSDEDLNVRIAAIENLPVYEDERMLSALKHFYSDPNSRIRSAVVKSLGQMENKQSYSVLNMALDDPECWVRYYAVKSIDTHGFTEAIGRIREIAVKDPVPFVRFAAIDYLGHTGGQLSVSILAALTGDPNHDIVIAAVNALGNVHHPDALPPLLALSRSNDTTIKRSAIEALGRRGGPGTAGALQWLAITEKDPGLKNASVSSLRSITGKEAVSALLNLTSDPENHDRAIAALASLPAEELELIAEGLNHKNTLVRTSVTEVLLRIRSPKASEKLAECLTHDDVNVRLAAIHALYRLGNRKYMKNLLDLKSSDPDPSVRKAVEEITRNSFPE